MQNLFLLFASYVFYGFADWRMIPLLLTVTALYYGLGIALERTSGRKNDILAISGVVLSLAILLYFKYFNFFIQSFSDLFLSLGLKTNWHTFSIILPLGLSYYSFKLISYVLEIRRGKMEACHDFISFAIFVAFFPTITAGPIDRPNRFIPQLQKTRNFDYFMTIDGCRQILWGLFKKMVIADTLSPIVDNAWTTAQGVGLVLAAILYTIQMYTDFSGYSDIAIGLGKMMGLKIAKNFNYPFFSTNISEFWRRWHMSLTSWLTDYVFMPLNVRFRNWGKAGIILAIIINMVLVGMWHGANWTYAVFGLYQGLLFIPVILKGKLGKTPKLKVNRFGLPCLLDSLKMIGIFLLYTFGAILFRSDNLLSAFQYYAHIFDPNSILFKIPISCLFFILVVLAVEWQQRNRDHGLDISGKGIFRYGWVRIVLYSILILLVLSYSGQNIQFIYFQF